MYFHQHNIESAKSFFDEVILHTLLETLKIIPFLLITYLVMEFIEHKASGKINSFIKKSGKVGPLAGSLAGIVPQCGFSAIAANLYTGGVITVGTAIAVFLSTSDEMIPILISGNLPATAILLILLYKLLCATAIGFGTDFILHTLGCKRDGICIDRLCESDGCGCDGGIVRSAIKHTVSISLFLLLITFFINILIFFIGEERLCGIMYDKAPLSHIIAALFGLIPNCSASVALASFYQSGIITLGTMLSGLFSGAGVGLLVLFRVNRNIKANLLITAYLVICGIVFGIIADVSGFSELVRAA